MKKVSVLFASLMLATSAIVAQNPNNGQSVPQIQVNGVGKVNVTPDRVVIKLGVEHKADDANSAKQQNDATVANVIKYVKSMKIDEKDIQTQRVNLYKTTDYKTKVDSYTASQTLTILLKDISKYETLVAGLMDSGINRIDGIEFKSSQVEQYEAEARTQAVNQAKQKAVDYASALGQKVGKAILVSDVASSNPPVIRQMYAMKSTEADSATDQTLAVGEIEVVSNVSISFSLE